MGTFLVLDIPKVPSDSTIWELRKSIFGIFGIKNLSRLDSRDMCEINDHEGHIWPSQVFSLISTGRSMSITKERSELALSRRK